VASSSTVFWWRKALSSSDHLTGSRVSRYLYFADPQESDKVSFLKSRLGAVRSLKLALVVDEAEEDIFSYASFPVEHWPKI
jgi:hypothetical protein